MEPTTTNPQTVFAHQPSNQDEQIRVAATEPRTLVVNTRSRRGQRLYARARELLREQNIVLDATYPVRDPGRLPEIVREAVRRGAKFLIVGGGDGTISSVVDELAYRDVVLGILPLGTANSFARTLTIPLDVEAAVNVIVHGKVADVDLGRIDGDYFANAAAFGLSSSIARSRLGLLKRYLGKISYPIVGGIKFFSHRPFRCTLTDANRVITVEALDILIANGRYQGGMLVAPDASLESRDLVIKIIKGPGRKNLAKSWARRVAGLPPDPALVEIVRATDIRIDASPTQHVAIDGEVLTRTPIRVAVAPNALKLMVPRDLKDVTLNASVPLPSKTHRE